MFAFSNNHCYICGENHPPPKIRTVATTEGYKRLTVVSIPRRLITRTPKKKGALTRVRASGEWIWFEGTAAAAGRIKSQAMAQRSVDASVVAVVVVCVVFVGCCTLRNFLSCWWTGCEDETETQYVCTAWTAAAGARWRTSTSTSTSFCIVFGAFVCVRVCVSICVCCFVYTRRKSSWLWKRQRCTWKLAIIVVITGANRGAGGGRLILI